MAQPVAKVFLGKAEEYLASAQDNLSQDRFTVAAGDAIHSGISAKDAIVTALTGTTGKGKDHIMAVAESRRSLGDRVETASAERALRELVAAKSEVEYGATAIPASRASALVRRASILCELASKIVRGQR